MDNNIRIIDTLVSSQSTAHSQKLDLPESQLRGQVQSVNKQYQYLKEEMLEERCRHVQESQEWAEEQQQQRQVVEDQRTLLTEQQNRIDSMVEEVRERDQRDQSEREDRSRWAIRKEQEVQQVRQQMARQEDVLTQLEKERHQTNASLQREQFENSEKRQTICGLQTLVQEKKRKLKEVKQCRQVHMEEGRLAQEQIVGLMEQMAGMERALLETRQDAEQEGTRRKASLREMQRNAEQRENALITQLEKQTQETEEWSGFKKEKRQKRKEEDRSQIDRLRTQLVEVQQERDRMAGEVEVLTRRLSGREEELRQAEETGDLYLQEKGLLVTRLGQERLALVEEYEGRLGSVKDTLEREAQAREARLRAEALAEREMTGQARSAERLVHTQLASRKQEQLEQEVARWKREVEKERGEMDERERRIGVEREMYRRREGERERQVEKEKEEMEGEHRARELEWINRQTHLGQQLVEMQVNYKRLETECDRAGERDRLLRQRAEKLGEQGKILERQKRELDTTLAIDRQSLEQNRNQVDSLQRHLDTTRTQLTEAQQDKQHLEESAKTAQVDLMSKSVEVSGLSASLEASRETGEQRQREVGSLTEQLDKQILVSSELKTCLDREKEKTTQLKQSYSLCQQILREEQENGRHASLFKGQLATSEQEKREAAESLERVTLRCHQREAQLRRHRQLLSWHLPLLRKATLSYKTQLYTLTAEVHGIFKAYNMPYQLLQVKQYFRQLSIDSHKREQILQSQLRLASTPAPKPLKPSPSSQYLYIAKSNTTDCLQLKLQKKQLMAIIQEQQGASEEQRQLIQEYKKMHGVFQRQQDELAEQKGVNLRLKERLEDKDLLVASISSQQVNQESRLSLEHEQEREQESLQRDTERFQRKQDLQRYLSQLCVMRQNVKEVRQLQVFYREQLAFFLDSFRRSLKEKSQGVTQLVLGGAVK